MLCSLTSVFPNLTAAEMRALESTTCQRTGLTPRMLMETAGHVTAQLSQAVLNRLGGRVVVICGGGNNGGDGMVAARALSCLHQVEVYLTKPRHEIGKEAAEALRALVNDNIALEDSGSLVGLAGALSRCDLVIDAILGTGCTTPVYGSAAEAIQQVLQATGQPGRPPVISIDLPSGVHTDTGAVLGQAVRAQHTVALGRAKRAHSLFPAHAHCGVIHLAPMGLRGPHSAAMHTVLPSQLPIWLPKRAPDSHKGDFGHVAIFAGSPQMPGAAVLALHGALRAGAGLVSWAASPETIALAAMRPPEAMLQPLAGEGDEAANETGTQVDGGAMQLLQKATAVVFGPGCAPNSKPLLEKIINYAEVPVVLDAEALNILAASPELQKNLRPDTVITPHPKEAARLLGPEMTAAKINADRPAAAAALHELLHCHVVLKGAGTLVVPNFPGPRQIFCIGAGNPTMATGGTGDVLAGMIGALLAQHQRFSDLAIALLSAVLWHAAAGEVAARKTGPFGHMLASELPALLGEVLQPPKAAA